jgi:ribosomal protein S18 acetylase RimI-like enzyme
MTYTITREHFPDAWPEIEPLARQHYAEMLRRFDAEGLPPLGAFNPRLDLYFRAAEEGYLHCFVVRCDGKVVGHTTVYEQQSMHSGEMFGKEDTIYIAPEHRNGIGMKLTKAVLAFLKERGCKRAVIDASTDPRAVKLWQRLGFRPVSQLMMMEL